MMTSSYQDEGLIQTNNVEEYIQIKVKTNIPGKYKEKFNATNFLKSFGRHFLSFMKDRRHFLAKDVISKIEHFSLTRWNSLFKDDGSLSKSFLEFLLQFEPQVYSDKRTCDTCSTTRYGV